jgi:hypothetical protein
MSIRIRIATLIALVALPGLVFGADVIFLVDSKTQSPALPAIEMACQFYGLQLVKIPVSSETEQKAVSAILLENHPQAVIASARALAVGGISRILKVSKRGESSALPVLVVDVDSAVDGHLLMELSAGKISGCVSYPGSPQPGRYQLGDIKRVARHLNQKAFAINLQTADFLKHDPASGAQDIVEFALDKSESAQPVFVMVPMDGREWFFLTRFHATCPLYVQRPSIDGGRILEALPFLMFLRYACGERCWQSPGYFANLTIDDPWLREPYGSLRFASLLTEMERVNFHTTLAFIPWNYDRSQPEVISLFREHPDRFSISIHGNNHDHDEFGDPKLALHREADIVQGLARMEAFTRLTGIRYDPVMVFPHAIASDAETLAGLKKHNFLSTINQSNIPLAMPSPQNLLFYLRSVTLDYANFPSVNRAAAYVQTESDFAIEMFLGNPILLYGHHDLFQKGPDSFNRLAETINKLEPSVQWATLGAVSRHLYLTRSREDGDYDVLALCRSIELENPRNRSATFRVHKPESFTFPIRRLTVDGASFPFERTAEGVDLVLAVPAGAKRIIDLEYETGLVGNSVEIVKNSNRVKILRGLSDFRDIRLSSFPLGRAVINLFYGSGAYRYTKGRLILFGLIVLVGMVVLLWLLFKRMRRIRARRRNTPVAGGQGHPPDL